MGEIRVIAMPYELDRPRYGVGRGPEHLLERGAVEALAGAGASVTAELVELEEPEDNEADGCFELMRRIASRVGAAVTEGAFPVVLSGSCFAEVGIVAGLGDRVSGVVWLDAHGDFNSPETAVFGYLDGMGTAILTGSAWQGLHATVPGARPIPETAFVLAGARAFDPPERERLDASAVVEVGPERLRSPDELTQAVASLEPSGLSLHVDLDVLDVDVARVNVYSEPNGITGDQLEALVSALLDRFPVRSVSLTAYDPECDKDDRVPPIALGLLRAVGERQAG